MAHDIEKICFLAARKIQAAWRGYISRKLLRTSQDWYIEVCQLIDGSSASYDITFNSHFLRPTITWKSNWKYNTLKSSCTSDSTEPIVAEISEQIKCDKEKNQNVSGNKSGTSSQHENILTIEHLKDSSTETPIRETSWKTQTDSTKEELIKRKNDITMELIWVQQAIQSRREYLKLREKLS